MVFLFESALSRKKHVPSRWQKNVKHGWFRVVIFLVDPTSIAFINLCGMTYLSARNSSQSLAILRSWPFWDGEFMWPFKWLWTWPPNRGSNDHGLNHLVNVFFCIFHLVWSIFLGLEHENKFLGVVGGSLSLIASLHHKRSTCYLFQLDGLLCYHRIKKLNKSGITRRWLQPNWKILVIIGIFPK